MLSFDRAHFDAVTAADRGLQLEVIGLFRDQVEAWRAGLASAEQWRDAAHTLKGSARGIGLDALAAAAEAAEAASEVDRAAALTQVAAALEAALTALEQFVANAS